MPARIYPIDSKGTYLRTNLDPQAKRPTRIALSAIAAKPGMYLGLQCVGSYIPGMSLPAERGLVGCFFAGSSRLEPGRFGQQNDVRTPNTHHGSIPTNVPEDFAIPCDKPLLVRVPIGATDLVFTAPDSFFGDNESNGYGVAVSVPNAPRPYFLKQRPPLPDTRVILGGESDSELRDHELMLRICELEPLDASFPLVTSFAASPFALSADEATRAQWRGWYVNTGWRPRNSEYNPKGIGGFRKHTGWDIFAPKGSYLVAPVGPARMDYIADVPGFGSVAIFRCRYGTAKFSVIYAHIQEIIGAAPRTVNAGEVVARAGCTGNASTEMCGLELNSGGFTDHVHVGLYKGWTEAKANHVPPDTLLNWIVD